MVGFHHELVFILVIFVMSNEIMSSKIGVSNTILKSLPLYSQVHNNNLGAIVDLSTLSGKKEKVAMEMAIEDFCAHHLHHMVATCPTLHVRNSQGDDLQASYQAKDLMKKHDVRAIIGLSTWQQTALLANFCNKSKIPILSLANEIPKWAISNWPFLVNAVRSQVTQMKAVAAIIQTWQWPKVNIIYEDINPTETGIAHLISSIHTQQSEVVADLLPLPPFHQNFNISHKLETLKNSDSRVFIVHTSISVATKIFETANKLGMMEKEFVWITTTSITNHIDSLSASTVAQMQGVLGVKTFFSSSGRRFNDFHLNFQVKFAQEYPNQLNLAPGFQGLMAFDAAWSLLLALSKNPSWKKDENYSSPPSPYFSSAYYGDELLKTILQSDFQGLADVFKFNKGELDPIQSFKIINIVGKSYRELGYWSEGLGFSKTIGGSGKNSKYNESMKILKNVIWGGDSFSVPRGRRSALENKPLPPPPPPLVKRLKIGLPENASFSEFVKVTYEYDNQKKIKKQSLSGLSIDIFQEVLQEQSLKNFPEYDFVPLNGTYDSMLEKVFFQEIDAMVADVSIVSYRYKYVEFSQPYTERGLLILIPNPKEKSRIWLFLKPFKPYTWVSIVLINIYNGVIIWLIERGLVFNNNDNQNHPQRPANIFLEFGTVLCHSFITLFSVHGNPKRNLSSLVLVFWLFLALIVTQSYTASLTSILTVDRLSPPTINFETLRRSGAKVGCSAKSFVVNYLINEQNFKDKNIVRTNTEDEFIESLLSGKIQAAILEVPYVKLLLAKYCDYLTTSGPIISVGGFGFAFPRDSPYLANISEAIIKFSERNLLEERERSMLESFNCSSSSSKSPLSSYGSLDFRNFLGVIAISGGASTIALFIFLLGKVLILYNNAHQEDDHDQVHQHEEQAPPQIRHHQDQDFRQEQELPFRFHLQD